jgi:hypothetical protein
MVHPYAKAVPYSTRIVLGVATVLGSLGGIHASGREDSILGKIDPEELVAHVSAMSDPNIELEQIDEEAAGALLGVVSYLGQLPAENRSKWFAAADPEAMIQGADAGARYALEQGEGSTLTGGLTGAGIGLLAGYTRSSEESDLENILDEDLLGNYRAELPE